MVCLFWVDGCWANYLFRVRLSKKQTGRQIRSRRAINLLRRIFLLIGEQFVVFDSLIFDYQQKIPLWIENNPKEGNLYNGRGLGSV